MDAHDALERGPVDLIVDPALSVGNPNNPTHTAGTTFMGQFMDHDITFDATSFLGVPTPPESAPNARTPGFDLDAGLRSGPDGSPHLYDGIRFRVESSGRFEDVPRTPDGTAIIADPRNDEHVIICGLQSAFLSFHNRAVDHVEERDRSARPEQVFARARRLTTWHYQWMILHEFLPLFVGAELTRSLLRRGRRVYRPKVPFIPVEFQGAAYRFGHSMVRPSYRANLAGDSGAPFFGLIFDRAAGGADPSDLRGGARAPRRFVGWQTFFDFGDGEVKPNKLIDTRISTPLFDLPLGAIASHDPPTALPQRNLLRHVTWGMPSGQRIARELGVDRLSRRDLHELSGLGRRSGPLDAALVLRAQGGRAHRRRPAPRARRRAHRRRGDRRPARARSPWLPDRRAGLETDTPVRHFGRLPHDGLPPLRRSRPGEPRPVAQYPYVRWSRQARNAANPEIAITSRNATAASPLAPTRM